MNARPIIRRDRDLQRVKWIWESMIARCHNPRAPSYPRYGGVGIFVCERWRVDFWAFYDDMCPRPPGHMLDRIDNTKGYEPNNCRWVTPAQSNRNRRYCVMVEGRTMKEYLRERGELTRYRMIMKRIAKGMPVSDALSTPTRTWPGTIHARR